MLQRAYFKIVLVLSKIIIFYTLLWYIFYIGLFIILFKNVREFWVSSILPTHSLTLALPQFANVMKNMT